MDQQSATPQAGGVEVTIILPQCCVLLGKNPVGTILTIGKGGEAKIASHKTRKGKTINRRSTGWETIMNASMDKLVKRLSERGLKTLVPKMEREGK